MLFIPIMGNAQTSEICGCADALLSMAKEAKDAKMEMEKMKAIQEKYKARMEKCDKLGKGKTDDEQKIMREEMEKCDSYKELEEIQKELMGESDSKITEEQILKEKIQERADSFYNRGFNKCNFSLEDDNTGAILDFDKAIELDHNFYQAYCYRGKAKLNLGDYTGAIKDLNIALYIDTSKIDYDKKNVLIISSIPNLTAEIYLYRGRAKNRLGDYRGAIIDLSKAIQYNDKYVNGSAFFELGFAKSYLKDYQGALLNYNKAIQLDSYYDVAYYNRALIKLNLNDKEGACMDLSRAGELGYEKAYQVIRENCN